MPEHPKCDKCGGEGPMRVDLGEVVESLAPVHKVVINGHAYRLIHTCEKCLK